MNEDNPRLINISSATPVPFNPFLRITVGVKGLDFNRQEVGHIYHGGNELLEKIPISLQDITNPSMSIARHVDGILIMYSHIIYQANYISNPTYDLSKNIDNILYIQTIFRIINRNRLILMKVVSQFNVG